MPTYRDPLAEYKFNLETALRDELTFSAPVGDAAWTRLAFVRVTPHECATEDFPAALITGEDYEDEAGNKAGNIFVVLYVPCDEARAAYFDLLELAWEVKRFVTKRATEQRFSNAVALRHTIRGLPATFNPSGDPTAPPTHLVLNLTLQVDWEDND